MKRILLLLLIVILAIAGYVWYKFSAEKGGGFEGEKAKKIEMNSTTPLFDKGIASVMAGYFTIKDAFITADTAAAKAGAVQLIAAIDSVNMVEIKTDTTGILSTVEMFLADVKNHSEKIKNAPTVKDMRLSFYDASQQLYPLLKAIKYKGYNLYWQNCPMAFDDEKEAYWLDTKTGNARTNPYLGKNDPKYGSSMLNCGEDKDSVIAR